MRTQITCPKITDGYDIFKVVTFRPPMEAIIDEMKSIFRLRKEPMPYIKWTKPKNMKEDITAYYLYKKKGEKEAQRIYLTFTLEYI